MSFKIEKEKEKQNDRKCQGKSEDKVITPIYKS